MTQVQAKELNNIWILTKLEESLGGDLWIQNLTLTMDVVTAALQETQDLLQETHDQTPQRLLARCSLAESSLVKSNLAELSLAELSLAELSHGQPAEYDWWI